MEPKDLKVKEWDFTYYLIIYGFSNKNESSKHTFSLKSSCCARPMLIFSNSSFPSCFLWREWTLAFSRILQAAQSWTQKHLAPTETNMFVRTYWCPFCMTSSIIISIMSWRTLIIWDLYTVGSSWSSLSCQNNKRSYRMRYSWNWANWREEEKKRFKDQSSKNNVIFMNLLRFKLKLDIGDKNTYQDVQEFLQPTTEQR